MRAAVADAASVPWVPAELGTIRLRDDQRLAAARVAQALEREGGCLLADDVGRGKTYVALAAARHCHWAAPLVVIPASLRHTWEDAIRRSGVACTMVSHEALSRGRLPVDSHDGIIVDESHRFRSPATKRHAALTRLAAHSQLLLLSATPLQNAARDLAAQLALFLGSAAFHWPLSVLARHVVRSGELPTDRLPAVASPQWLRPVADDSAVLGALLALPVPPAPYDAGDAGTLRTIGLVRAWASSRAALVATLRRRRRVAVAIEQCAASGLAPSRRDVNEWNGYGGDVQLALAPMLVQRALGADPSLTADTLAAEMAGLATVEEALSRTPDPDVARAAALRSIRLRHPGESILAFSEFATTVRAYFASMRADAGVGLLTATEARIASGRLPRDALLAHVAPVAQGATPPNRRTRVTLLLATDLLSEGVNLQDASVVVHLDLPWNPARLAQRVGRVRRPGGAALVHSYLLAPPARTELLLQVEARLREKLRLAERGIGRSIPVLPVLVPAEPFVATEREAAPERTSADSLGRVADLLARWRRPPGRRPRVAALVAAAVGEPGWLAALDDGRLLVRTAHGTTDDGEAVSRAVALAAGHGRPCGTDEAERALAEARRWLEHERLMRECGVVDEAGPLDRPLTQRIAAAVRRAPRHERAATLALATELAAALRSTRSLGAERELHAAIEQYPEKAIGIRRWLELVVAITRRSPGRRTPRTLSDVVALIVFGGDHARGETTTPPP